MQNPSVLIIDDCEIERNILSHQLKKIGISYLVQESDGIAGLEFLKDYANNKVALGDHFPPNLIILDVNMLTMDGFEFLREFAQLKTQHDLDKCHIAMYSGSNDPKEKTAAYQYDFVKAFMVKGETTLTDIQTMIAKLI
jgi:CheY-like chemotaxis protein